jgi:hypothetical protein
MFSLAESGAYKDVELSMIEQGADADLRAYGLLNSIYRKNKNSLSKEPHRWGTRISDGTRS